MKARRLRLAAMAGAILLTGAAGAASQTAQEDSVRVRPRPEFDALGLDLDEMLSVVGLVGSQTVAAKSSPLSSFIVFPKLDTSASYDSNLFREAANPVSDRIATLAPSLAIQSNWANHAFGVTADTAIGTHQRTRAEDYTDYGLAGSGRIDLTEATRATAALSWRREHEARGTIDDRGRGTAAGEFARTKMALGGEYDEELLLRLKLGVERFDFSDTGSIDNSDRNRTETTVTTRLGYELVPGTTVFVEPQVNWRSFERGIDAEGDRQGSNGHQVLVGSTWDLTGVMFAELGIGYMRQDFDEARFAAVSGPSFSGTLIWNPDDALSITATVRRAIEETRRIDASGVLVTDTGLRLDYELRDNLIASLDTSYVRSQIEGTGRLDNLYGVKLEIAYLFGPHVWLTGSLKRTRRNSNEPGFDYDNSTVLVTLSLRE